MNGLCPGGSNRWKGDKALRDWRSPSSGFGWAGRLNAGQTNLFASREAHANSGVAPARARQLGGVLRRAVRHQPRVGGPAARHSPAVAAVPDREMPQLALVVVSGRTDAVTELITRRLHALSHRRSPQTFDAGVAAHQAVREMSACPHRSGSAVHRSIERGMLHEQPGDRSAATTACPRPQATSCAADTSVRPPKQRPGRGGPGRDAEGIAWPSRR